MPHLFAFCNLRFFNCNGVRLFLTESDAQANESILYFHVEDIHVAHDGLKNRGVEFINAPHLVHRHEDGRE